MISLGAISGGAETRDMDVILAHHPLENLDLEGFAGLADQFPSLEGNIPLQYVIPILRDKHKVVLDLENRMATVSILHLDNSAAKGFKDKSDRLKAVVLTLLRTIKIQVSIMIAFIINLPIDN
jgi:hypothetical protein